VSDESPGLLIHVHGGGWISQSSKSRERVSIEIEK
jgi:acetyl esterase/lipase